MLLIREFSDLHLEHMGDTFLNDAKAANQVELMIPSLETDISTVLIIAGDLASAHRPQRVVTFMRAVISRFRHVIYVLGNHEHYQGRINTSKSIITEALLKSNVDTSKLTIAGNNINCVNIDDIKFYCGTMWTDYNKGDDDTASLVSRYITDHRVIKNDGGFPFSPADAAAIHTSSLLELEAYLSGRDNSKTVIVTHHMPSYTAVDPQYLNGDFVTQALNAAFATNLDDFIIKHSPAMWFFGHTHTKYNGVIGNTKLVCNPLGYPNENNFGTNDSARKFDLINLHNI